jgi:hypothetical protein
MVRKCVKEISPLKSRMGFHPRRWCGIVLLVRDHAEWSGYSLTFRLGRLRFTLR